MKMRGKGGDREMRRKVVVTLNIGNYQPEVRSITYPFLMHWADKIGADFVEITERKFPEWPVVYEKLQCRDIIRRGYEWLIFYDADTLVYPDCPDWTALVPKDHVACYGFDWAPIRWSMDRYFLRDGRMIGTAGWCTIASEWCDDIWTPLDMSPEEAIERLHPTVAECQRKMEPSHLIDDYTVSRNVARFGLKAVGLMALMGKYSQEGVWYVHNYEVPSAEKADYLRKVISEDRLVKDSKGEEHQVPGWRVPISMLKGGPWNGGWVKPKEKSNA
jgi:hypothetical protein